jgi:hypothetical protein
MCEPTTILALTAIGTAVSAYGQYQSGKAQEAQYEYQSAVSRNNSIIAEQNAQDATKRGAAEADTNRRKVASFVGTQRAGFGASGAMVDSGSPLDIIADTAMLGELDTQNILGNAEREARGYRTQGMNFQAESGLMDSSAKSAGRAGVFNAGSTILGGGTQFADKWYNYYGAK